MTAAAQTASSGGDQLLSSVKFSQKLHDMLPADVLASKSVRVSTTAYTPPITFYGPDNKEIIGIDSDIMNAFSVMFGIPFQETDIGVFSAIVPTLKSKRFDMSIGGFFDTVEAEKQLDMVDYMYDGNTILVQRGNPRNIQSMDDLCGKAVGVTSGTPTEAQVVAKSKTCATPIEITSIPKTPDVFVALRSGRVTATVSGYTTSNYTTSHQIGGGIGLQALPNVRTASGYLGIVFDKGNEQLRDAVAAGMQELIDSGAYLAIMKKWESEAVAIPKTAVNGAAAYAAANK